MSRTRSATPLIDEVYKTRVVRDADGNERRIRSEVDRAEGDYLYRLVSSDPAITSTLEIGCAFGLSSIHICEALRTRPGALHTIVDPHQSDAWHRAGVWLLERAGIDFFELIEEPSELALPSLLRSRPEGFDFIFIDGWHTFDHTMLDLFYANRLLRIGGYVAVDDCSWPAISAAVSYYSNYPGYELVQRPTLAAQSWRHQLALAARTVVPPRLAEAVLPTGIHNRVYRRVRHPSIVALRKVSADERPWTWFESF